ncbi:hypothetical protein CIW52_23790 [Mycolicibacterium sp. P9-64]|nr:hypothetical protein CIW52_23790 [Mycolicibacterium sp. P9-64]
MVGPGAWPETDESVFSDRAIQLNEKLSALKGALEGWGSHQASIFNGPHVWSGVGASAAGGKVEANAQAMRDHEQQLRDAIGWCNEAASRIGSAKQSIYDNVTTGIDEINQTLDAASQSDQDPTAAIDAIVQRKYGENVATLGKMARLLGYKGDLPAAPLDRPLDTPANTDPNKPADVHNFAPNSPAKNPTGLLNGTPISQGGGVPPPLAPAIPGKGPVNPAKGPINAAPPSVSGPPGVPPARAPAVPTQGAVDGTLPSVPPPAPVVPQAPVAPRPATPSLPPAGSPAPAPGGSAGSPGVPSIGSPGGPSGGGAPSPLSSGPAPSVSPAAFDPTQAAAAGPQTAGAAPQTPAQAFGQGLANAANAGPPVQAASAPLSPAAPPVSAPITDQAAPVPPPSSLPSAPGGPVGGPPAPAPPMGGGPMMGGPVAPSMPLGPPSTPPPAAPLPPVNPAGLGAPVVPPVNPNAAAIAGAAIPVSVARAEREAIARSMRRAGAGNDPAQVARRIAAALNAEPSVDFGFYWMTALAADGTIVVANSYGIGYIPEGVKLPEQVKVASADESISPADRGRWATYPLLSLQGWAQHHAVGLRQVIATEAQFKGFDAGAARITLQPDDIPESGQMQGRSRLEVIAPAAAATLAGVADSRLSELLPVAQTDVNPPADETFNKWFEVMKPMMSEASDRGQAHLRAFIDYADHAQEKYLFMAHNAVDATAQRAAIADWVYWQHLSVLMSDALVGLQPA